MRIEESKSKSGRGAAQWAGRVCVLGSLVLALAGCNRIDAVPSDGAALEAAPAAELLARADSGKAEAQLEVGRFHATAAEEADEPGSRARHQAEALRWLTLAAEQEDAAAQAELGILLVSAETDFRNVAEGRRWLSRAT
jgi:TPR repeat protein